MTFDKQWLVAALVLLAACGYSHMAPRPGPAADVRTVTEIRQYATALDWQQTPWSRIDDAFTTSGTFYVVLSDSQACLVPPALWTVTHVQQRFVCPGTWRIARRAR